MSGTLNMFQLCSGCIASFSVLIYLTNTWNSLVRLRHQCHHRKPDWPRKCPWQDHETTSCDVWSRKTTSRSHSGPHGTASGCQGKKWSPPRQQAAVETSTWPASPSVDATTGSRHRTRRWYRMGHSQWSSSMEGTTTHRRSSGLMNEWINITHKYSIALTLSKYCMPSVNMRVNDIESYF